MFQDINAAMMERMEYLEALDYRDRRDGTPRLQRLRQITPDTGRFLALMAAGAPEGDIVEIGTSAGYSTMWLSLACRELGRQVTTYELLPEKAALARETFRQAGVEQFVNLVEGDARNTWPRTTRLHVAFWMRRRTSTGSATSWSSRDW